MVIAARTLADTWPHPTAVSFLWEFGDLVAEDRIILKWTLRKWMLWRSGHIWHQTGTSGGLLRKCNAQYFRVLQGAATLTS